jgi:hypothetical protein
MDTWEFTFARMYQAITLLSGFAASKLMGTEGIIALLRDRTLIAGPAAYVGASLPSKVLGFHSTHAQILFNVIRATEKYKDKRQQLRDIQAAMDKFRLIIDESIKTSSPIPTKWPEAGIEIFFDQKSLLKHRTLIDSYGEAIKVFVNKLDLVLYDISRCINEWNKFLEDLKRFLRSDKQRNIFESLGHISLHKERDLVWYGNEANFSIACNRLLRHRNEWSKLIDYGNGAPLPRLNPYAK